MKIIYYLLRIGAFAGCENGEVNLVQGFKVND
jgi:hypothetical protein